MESPAESPGGDCGAPVARRPGGVRRAWLCQAALGGAQPPCCSVLLTPKIEKRDAPSRAFGALNAKFFVEASRTVGESHLTLRGGSFCLYTGHFMK